MDFSRRVCAGHDVHLLHGMPNVGNLAIYTAAAWHSPQARVIRARASLAMTHQEIIQRFEMMLLRKTLSTRLTMSAWRCLSVRISGSSGLERFATALKRFAAARGKAQLYHETITHAYFFLIRERMAGSQGGDWDEFARQNPDLLCGQTAS